VEGELFFYVKLRQANLITLEELVIGNLDLSGENHQVRISVKPKEIMSIMLFPERRED